MTANQEQAAVPPPLVIFVGFDRCVCPQATRLLMRAEQRNCDQVGCGAQNNNLREMVLWERLELTQTPASVRSHGCFAIWGRHEQLGRFSSVCQASL